MALSSELRVAPLDDKSKKSSEFSLQDIQTILDLLRANDVTEFRLERGGEKLFLRRGPEPTPVISAPMGMSYQGQMPQLYQNQGMPSGNFPQGAPSAPQAGGAPAPTVEAKPEKGAKEVLSPMVGTFYKRPAVDAKPYVSVGDIVKKGDVLCILEAMKIMNEIETEIAGKVVEVCLDDGQMVEYGEVLFRIEPS